MQPILQPQGFDPNPIGIKEFLAGRIIKDKKQFNLRNPRQSGVFTRIDSPGHVTSCPTQILRYLLQCHRHLMLATGQRGLAFKHQFP